MSAMVRKHAEVTNQIRGENPSDGKRSVGQRMITSPLTKRAFVLNGQERDDVAAYYFKHHAVWSIRPSRVVGRHKSYREVQQATEEGPEFVGSVILRKAYLRGGRNQFGENGNVLCIRLERRTVDPIQELLKDRMEDLDKGCDGGECLLVPLVCIKSIVCRSVWVLLQLGALS